MTSMPERPEALQSRLPKPASDESVDPVDLRSPVDLRAAAPVPSRRRRKEPTVQLGTRVSESVADRVADYANEQGMTQREVIEMLVKNHLPG